MYGGIFHIYGKCPQCGGRTEQDACDVDVGVPCPVGPEHCPHCDWIDYSCPSEEDACAQCISYEYCRGRARKKPMEGKIKVAETETDIHVAILACETDFTAKTAEVSAALDEVLADPTNSQLHVEIRDRLKEETKESIAIDVAHWPKETPHGVAYYYVHHDDRKAAVVALATSDRLLCRRMAMQLVAHPLKYHEDFLSCSYIFDPSKTVREVLGAAAEGLRYEYYDVSLR